MFGWCPGDVWLVKERLGLLLWWCIGSVLAVVR